MASIIHKFVQVNELAAAVYFLLAFSVFTLILISQSVFYNLVVTTMHCIDGGKKKLFRIKILV